MTTYRITMPVMFIVEINDENALSDPRPPLQGDSPVVAVRRAMMSALSRDREKSETWGVKRTMLLHRPEDAEVVVMPVAEVAAMEAHEARVRAVRRLPPESDTGRKIVEP